MSLGVSVDAQTGFIIYACGDCTDKRRIKKSRFHRLQVCVYPCLSGSDVGKRLVDAAELKFLSVPSGPGTSNTLSCSVFVHA